MSKKTFTVKVNGKDLVLKSAAITPEIRLESQQHFARAFRDAIDAGHQLKAEAEKLLEKRGLLDFEAEDKEAEVIRKEIKDMEIRLRKGLVENRRMTKEEGRDLAIAIKKHRVKLGSIGSNVNEILNNTVESIAENERLQYFIYACTVDPDTGKRYWKNYDLFKAEENAELVGAAAKNFLAVISNLDQDYEKNLYENQWLIKQGFMNDKLQFIRKDGKIVDENNRLVNEEGRFVNEEGQYVDVFGNPIDKDGNLIETDTWGVSPIATPTITAPATATDPESPKTVVSPTV